MLPYILAIVIGLCLTIVGSVVRKKTTPALGQHADHAEGHPAGIILTIAGLALIVVCSLAWFSDSHTGSAFEFTTRLTDAMKQMRGN